MNITLSQSTQLYFMEIVRRYRIGDICLNDLVMRFKHKIQQLANVLLSWPDFLSAFGSARHYIPSHNRPIYASTLSQNHAYRITLLGIPEHSRIPLHDHPDMVSILLFLSGRIYSPRYQLVSEREDKQLVELIHCSEKTYSVSEIVVLTPDSCNLHSLEALTAHAVCLSMQIGIQSRLNEQSYYFPFMHDPSIRPRGLWYRASSREHHHDV